jgi:hypothetical protein
MGLVSSQMVTWTRCRPPFLRIPGRVCLFSAILGLLRTFTTIKIVSSATPGSWFRTMVCRWITCVKISLQCQPTSQSFATPSNTLLTSTLCLSRTLYSPPVPVLLEPLVDALWHSSPGISPPPLPTSFSRQGPPLFLWGPRLLIVPSLFSLQSRSCGC